MRVDGSDFARQELVVLNTQRSRVFSVFSALLKAQYSGAASNAYIFGHGDFGRHRQRDLNDLTFRKREVGADQRTAGTQIQGESVAGLSVNRSQKNRDLVLLETVAASAFDTDSL